jgi:probable F420-dependent oxidoreductase
MRIGFAVPQFGVFADPDVTASLSASLEASGCDSLWVADRLLAPLAPRDAYPGGSPMPPQYGTHLDPLLTLGVVAAATGRVRLGSATLNGLLLSPVLLARALTTLDLISHGRLEVGLGLGWMRDEYEAAGVPWAGRGARLDEALDVLTAVWTSDPVAHSGRAFSVPASRIGARPRQRPHPPVLLGGFSPGALERVGRRADGWLAAAMPLPLLDRLWAVATSAAERAGRDGSRLRRVVKVNPEVTDRPVPEAETYKRGTVGQICDHLRRIVEWGAEEVVIDPQLTVGSVGAYEEVAHRFMMELRL